MPLKKNIKAVKFQHVAKANSADVSIGLLILTDKLGFKK